MAEKTKERPRKPDWLKIRVRCGENLGEVNDVLSRYGLNTVCREANCPNRMECYSRRTATFLILGAVCTRNCRFCNVTPGTPGPLDPDEPRRVTEAVRELHLLHAVITSVTRDDLADGGSAHFAETVSLIKRELPGVSVEVLIPDFKGDEAALLRVLASRPDVLNHNVETVPRLYSAVRPQARYERSLEVLGRAKKAFDASPSPGRTKSGIMVGLGESRDEVLRVFEDLRFAGCDFLTIGQYLAPSRKHFPVAEYITPETFARYRDKALELGFLEVAAGPFVRSSYKAGEMVNSSPAQERK